jgi:hypothetical protein
MLSKFEPKARILGRETKSPIHTCKSCLSVCPYLVRYLLRDGWVDWTETWWVEAGGLNLGLPRNFFWKKIILKI